MKKTFLLLLLSCLFSVSYSQTPKKTYEGFKTGKFTYLAGDETVLIIRKKNTQTEIFNNGESKIILRINWLDDSNYTLTLKKAINAPGCLNKGDTINARIIKRSSNEYTCTYTSKNCGSGESTFTKVN